LLRPHALVDLGDGDAAARRRREGGRRGAGHLAACDLVGDRLLERAERGLARDERLLASVEVVAPLADRLEQLAEAAALREEIGGDARLRGRRTLGAGDARPPPRPEEQ